MARVLVVEDNELVGGLLKEWLKRRNFEAHWATDGGAGVRMAHELNPDLILMDLSLPVLDGWSATRQLRATPDTAAIPIIAVTAHAIVGERERALAAGCDAYFSKPFEFTPLFARIDELIANSKKNSLSRS